MATYLLIDGHSLAFRAYFALKDADMTTTSGQETQAVYGFVSMLTRLLDDFRPSGVVVAFDRSEPTFRDAIIEDYKGGRDAMPEPLTVQVGIIREFVEALGYPLIDVAGFEADDVIGTLARRISESGDDVVIVTGDRDTYQLVSDPHVRVLYNRRGVTDYVMYDEAGIEERTGVRPVEYPLYAALRGDPSDNIPGVPGVGEKTAARLVQEHHDLDTIFANLESLTPKLRESLRASEELVRRNLLLTPIDCDVPIDEEITPTSHEMVDRPALERLFGFLEMRTLKERLFAVLDAVSIPGTASDGDRADEPRERPIVILTEAGAAVAHLEATSRNRAAPLALEACFAGAPGRSVIEGIALMSPDDDSVHYLRGDLLNEPSVTRALGTVVSKGDDGTYRIVAHRSKELMRSLLPLGVDMTGLALDTAVVTYLVDPVEGQHELEALADRRGISSSLIESQPSGQLEFGGPESDDAGRSEVAARRAELIEAVSESLSKELDSIGARALWEEVERPLVRVLARMEVVGIGVDTDRLKAINKELTDEARRLEGEIHALAGEPFNLNSPPQLRVVLYDKLGLKPQKKTKTGYSTDAQTLEKLRDEHPIVELLLAYREVEKLRSTYGTGLLSEIGPDGRIHASFGQTVARTGRLSSDAPNLHNIPVRSEIGRQFREAFVPTNGSSFLVADYNQIELRVIAHLSGDPGLVEAFANRRDIHATTASGVFGVEVDDVTPAMRARAKMISYGLAYGMEAYGLSQRLSVPVEEASAILNQYFAAFPSVRSYMDQTVQEARLRGYTETERGRRRHLPELSSGNFRLRQAAERQAMNAGIQGLAADIFKIALVDLDAGLESRGLSSRIVLQVHDEIIVEAGPEEADEVMTLTHEAMENAYPLKVPLEINVAWGKSWADAKHA